MEYLSDGLEGRSNNPVSILYDLLKQPDSDLGIDRPTCLSWKYDPLTEIDHVVIGKSAGPGGAWNDIEGSQLTISPNKWMELPDMSFINWERQSKLGTKNSNVNAGLVFSAKNSNFSEDSSLLNANYVPKQSRSDVNYNLSKYLKNMNPDENARASMKDVRNYYRDYVKQKNMEKYLLNNATVTNVRRICCPKFVTNQCKQQMAKSTDVKDCPSLSACNGKNDSTMEALWEVTGLIDKRDRRKASSLSHGKFYTPPYKRRSDLILVHHYLLGDINEFRFICKHLVLACGANDLNNTLNVKGENFRYIIRSLRELEDKILEDATRFQKDPLLIVGAGLTAADALLLAQKHKIKVIHVIRRSVFDPELVFKTLPKQVYPEYQEVYEMMLNNRYVNLKKQNQQTENQKDLKTEETSTTKNVLRSLSQNDLNNNLNEKYKAGNFNILTSPDSVGHLINAIYFNKDEPIADYTLYDEHEVKYFTSKRTCKLIPIVKSRGGSADSQCKSSNKRHQQIQKQIHELHKRCLSELGEEQETSSQSNQSSECPSTQHCMGKEFKVSYACILIGYAPDLDFMPADMLNNLAVNTDRELDTKNNPILVDECSHESSRIKNLYAMGPLIGDNFVRFGTGGALAISNKIVKARCEENGLGSPVSKKPFSCPMLKNLRGTSEAVDRIVNEL